MIFNSHRLRNPVASEARERSSRSSLLQARKYLDVTPDQQFPNQANSATPTIAIWVTHLYHLCRLDAVQPRHIDAQDDYLGAEPLDRSKRLLLVGCLADEGLDSHRR